MRGSGELWPGLVPLHVLGMDLSPVNGYVVRSRGMLAAQLAAGAEPRAVLPPTARPAAEEADELLAGRLFRVPHPAAGGAAGGAAELLVAASYRLRSRLRRAAGGERRGLPGGRRPPSLPLARRWLAVEDRVLMRRVERVLVRLGGELRPDLLHAHSPHRAGLPAIAAGRRLGLPSIYEMRGLWEESAIAEGLWRRGSYPDRAWRRLEDAALRRADAVIAIGQALRGEAISRGAAAERTFVVPNAVDGELAAEAAAVSSAPGGAPGGCTFGYVGSLRPLEGVDLLLRGVAALRARGRVARALVVGGGPDLPRLERLAAELGLGASATFTGRRPRSEVPALYRRIDVFAVTRPDEPVCRLVPPLKPLEAMAMGLPVVASDLPALRELVAPCGGGVLVPAGEPEAFAAAVEPLYDPALRRRLGEAGRAWVLAHRTWAAVLPLLEEVYAAVGAGRGRG